MAYEKINDKTIISAKSICNKVKKISLPMLQYKLKLTFNEASFCLSELMKAEIINEQDNEGKYDVIMEIGQKDQEKWMNNKINNLIEKLTNEERKFCIKILPLAPFKIDLEFRQKMLNEYSDYSKILMRLCRYEIIELQNNNVVISIPNNYIDLFMNRLNDLSKENKNNEDAITNDYDEEKECFLYTEKRKKAEIDEGKKNNEDDENNCSIKNNANKDELQLSIYDDEKGVFNADIINLLKGKINLINDDPFLKYIEFIRGKEKITILFIYDNDKVVISDLGATMKFMAKKYVLDSKDVKDCINSVMLHYEIYEENTERGNELKKVIESKEDCFNNLLQLYDCMIVLKDMSLFFNNPNE
jgi:hypothetical protein